MANITRERRMQMNESAEAARKPRKPRRQRMTQSDLIPFLGQCESLAEKGHSPEEISESLNTSVEDLTAQLQKAGYALTPNHWELNYISAGFIPKAVLRKARDASEEE